MPHPASSWKGYLYYWNEYKILRSCLIYILVNFYGSFLNFYISKLKFYDKPLIFLGIFFDETGQLNGKLRSTLVKRDDL